MVRGAITVVETLTFVARAKDRMSDEERHRAIDMIAADPECGRLIQGGGGLRKVRFGIGGRGKRGGIRIVYYYHNPLYRSFCSRCSPRTSGMI